VIMSPYCERGKRANLLPQFFGDWMGCGGDTVIFFATKIVSSWLRHIDHAFTHDTQYGVGTTHDGGGYPCTGLAYLYELQFHPARDAGLDYAPRQLCSSFSF
jgi:hypothetical protein